MIKIQSSVSKAWLNREGGFEFTDRYYLDPIYRREQDRIINTFIRTRFPSIPIYNMEDNLVQAEYVRDNHVLVGAIQPNMIIAAMLGSEFSFFGDKDADVSGRPLENIRDASELPPPEKCPEHTLIRHLDEQIRNIAVSNPGLRVIPPFFWDESGRATIHGIITTSLKLTGENIMMSMMINPDLAHAIHKWIAEVYIVLVRHFAEKADLKITSVHVGECSGTMLSAGSFDEFIVPYLSLLGEKLGPIRLHSCGFSDHLITPASKIRNLKILDVGSGTSVKEIRSIMGNDFEINIFPPMSLLMKETDPAKVSQWLEEVLRENNNGPLKIAYHLEPDYGIENVLIIHEQLEKQRLVSGGRIY